MKNLPKDWKGKELGEIVDFSGGAQPPRSTFIFEPKEGYTRLIQTRDYRTNKYVTYIPSELVRKRCGKNDIMIGRYGPPIFQIFRGLEGGYNVALLKAVPKKNELLNDYLYYFINQYNVWAFVENLSQRSGGQTGVDLAQLRKYPFPLPPLTEQQKIADILSTVDEKIEVIGQQITETEELKKGLMQRLLTKGIGHTEFKDSPLGMIPKKWTVIAIQDLFDFISTKSFSRAQLNYVDGDVLYVHYGDIHSTFRFPVVDLEEVDLPKINPVVELKGNVEFLKDGDLILSDASEDLEGVGKCVEISNVKHRKVIGGLHTLVMREKGSTIINGFKTYLIQSPEVLGSIKRIATGASVLGVSKGNIRKILVAIPPVKEQEKMVNIFTALDKKLSICADKRTYYNELKQGLMQNLLTGRIRTHNLIEA